MRRTKEWWARLDKYERSYLVYLERRQHKGGSSPYYPDDCSECGGCGLPMVGGGFGLCSECGDQWEALVAKGDGEVGC